MNSVTIIIDKGNSEFPKPQKTVHPIFSFGQLLGYLLIVRSTLGISYSITYTISDKTVTLIQKFTWY